MTTQREEVSSIFNTIDEAAADAKIRFLGRTETRIPLINIGYHEPDYLEIGLVHSFDAYYLKLFFPLSEGSHNQYENTPGTNGRDLHCRAQ
jgi:hypothetical protein